MYVAGPTDYRTISAYKWRVLHEFLTANHAELIERCRLVVATTLTRTFAGADARIRTGDLRITNALLYQLSYTGLGRII